MSHGIETLNIAPLPDAAIDLPPPVAVVEVTPEPGLYPARGLAGEPFRAHAHAVAPAGLAEMSGVLRWRKVLAPRWEEVALTALGDNHFEAEWTPAEHGNYEWCVELWTGGAGNPDRPGSSGGDTLHLLRIDRSDLAGSPWFESARDPLNEIAEGLASNEPSEVGVLLLAPIFPQDTSGIIGSEGAGHYTIDPILGNTESFGTLAGAARAAGISLALTLPVECSPGHPFRERFPDAFGSASATPDFAAGNWRELWNAWEAVFRFWLVQGIDIFHIPAPENAPVSFWQTLLENLREDFPDTVFTAPAAALANKFGEHLTGAGFTCAPLRIASEAARLELAPLAPLTPFPIPAAPELVEELEEFVATEEPANDDSIPCTCSNPSLTVVIRQRDGAEILQVENDAPDFAQSGHIHLPGDRLGIAEHDLYYLRDLANGRAYRWSGTTNYLSLSRGDTAKSFRIERN